jgi:hypothetical protein
MHITQTFCLFYRPMSYLISVALGPLDVGTANSLYNNCTDKFEGFKPFIMYIGMSMYINRLKMHA